MKRVFLCIYVCLAALLCGAQQINVIKVSDIAALADHETSLCVYVTNTSNDIVAMQMDIMLPQGMTIDASSATLSDRASNHVLQVKPTNGGYRFMVYSPQNQPIRGNSGLLLTVNARLDDHFLSDSEYPMSISRATLGDSDGNNLLTSTECGSIIIQPSPDFVVTTLAASPQKISPEGEIMVSWTVANQGTVASTGGWSEQIILVDNNGGKTLLGKTYFNDPLLAGEAVSRQTTIKVPQHPGLEGSVKVQVQLAPNSDSGERPEYQTNNTKISDDILLLSKSLFVEMPVSVTEGKRTITCKLMRSGSWLNEESFSLTLTGDDRVTVPQTVTIAQGSSSAYFNLALTDNDLLDNDSIIKITIEGNGYPAIVQQLIIEDNEYPDLTLTTSKSQMTEGETLQLTITTSRPSPEPVVVTLTSENSKRFTFPSEVTIPAGKSSVTIDVTATDDDVPSLILSNVFTASAPKHNKAEVIVILEDNDLPVLELQITPTTVSESAGVVAVAGVLRRTTNTNSKITVKLTDDADGGLYFGNRTLTLDKGVEEVHFNFGPIDNALVDGDRTYAITAAVWLSSCNCGATGESAGYVTAQLQVLDNDGAALSLTSSANTVKEGGKTTLTVSRNTSDTSKALTVTLSSDYEEGLTYNHTVTIPAGQQSATVEVTSAANSIQGDSHTVVFTVQANGYATGTCYLNVTDQTMPDARITALRADRTQIEVGEQLSLTVVVANEGVASLPSGTSVMLNFSGSPSNRILYIPTDLAVGDSVILSTEYAISSTKPGNYTLKAIVNNDKEVRELNYNNNTSQNLVITLLPNFTATAITDKNIYRQGETITISGQTSVGGRNANVEVYLVNDGARQSITVQSDDEGNFETTYQPYNRQAGHFIIGACYPGTGETVGSAEFDVYGLRLSSYYDTHDISLGDEAKGTIVVENPGQLSQTGMAIVPQTEAGKNVLTLGSVSAIKPGEKIEIPYTLKGNVLTDGSDWQQIPLRITTAEGCSTDYTIYYYVRSLRGQLKASQTRIETNITKGVPRDYQFQISNVGRGETGRITLSLPSWVESLTPFELPSMNQGDTATVVLRLKTTDDMQLNVPVTGQIGINCDNGNGVPISLKLTPVSEVTGHLVIDVVDEYSYYAEGSPHVEGAKVLVKHPTTGQIVAQGQTASDGHYTIELPEGWYTVSINADMHQSYQTTLEVAPGKQTGKQIFLTYEAITYNWEVTETEVEDVYEIETVVKYETNVPKPVIIINLPDEKPETGSVIGMAATNKGLISANKVDASLSISEGYELEWLTDPTLAVLAPQQSVVFYARVKEKDSQSARRKAPGENVGTCISLAGKIRGLYECGDYEEGVEALNSRAWGDCASTSSHTGGGTSGGSSGSGGWNSGGGYSSNRPTYSPDRNTNSSYAGAIWYGPSLSPTTKVCHEKDVVLLTDLAPVSEPIKGGCGDTKINGFVLIPDEGPGYNVRGVAADGESKVRIVFTGENTIPADENCGNPHWSIKEGIGELENANSWDNVVYKAPKDFPGDETSSSFTVHAVLDYNINGATRKEEVEIVITRVPLALIHGLNSNEKCWEKYAKHITSGDKKIEGIGMYEDYQILRVDYSDTHFRHFAINEHVVQNAIDELYKRYITNGIVSSKADLIGHSMGGILSRLHVQYIDNTNVHKLITVNTPHSGSPWGNWVSNLPVDNGFSIIKDIWTGNLWHGGYDGAIRDLAIGSEATDSYLNDNYSENSTILKRMNGIPIHSVASFLKEDPDYSVFYSLVAVLKSGVVSDIKDILDGYRAMNKDIIEDYNHIDEGMNVIHNYHYVELKDLNDFLDGLESAFTIFKHWGYGLDMADALAVSDCVVPYDSQTGGLTDNHCKTFHDGGFCDVSHIFITDVTPVWNHLDNLLNASVDDNMFSKNGFHPIKLEYTDHSLSRGKLSKSVHQSSGNGSDSSAEIMLNIVRDSLQVTVKKTVGFDKETIVLMKVGGTDIIKCGDNISIQIPSTHQGNIKVYALTQSDDGILHCDSTFIYIASPRTTPVDIECPQICQITTGNSHKIPLSCLWADGSVTTVIPDAATFTDNLASYADGVITGLHGGSGTVTFTYQGLTCDAPFTVYNFGKNNDDEGSKSVCSTITLKLSQTMTMTRQAFRGTLTVFNGNASGAMKDVRLSLTVTDPDGKTASSHEFQINAESLDGFTGEVDLTSGWTLAANATGTATVLFIPTKYAAPTEPVEWSFGGTLSYIDPYTGLEVTRDLYPVTLTVKPSPELDLTYFMQRDVYGDDPLTLDVVEPMKPAEFALLINNKGYGDATNVRMVTQQPEIIENEKGLHINFELISSQVNGGDAALSFGQSIANDFGTIPAHSQMYAQWWLQSSLLGHFTEYDVKATHVTSYGNEDLSLLGDVTIHELIHSIDLSTADKNMRGFLVNDIADANDLPDMLYFTNGETTPVVSAATAEIVRKSSTECELTITPSASGWNYGSVMDPTYGYAELKSIIRKSDGKEIGHVNFWQTDRTLLDGKDWLYEYRLHFVDEFASQSEQTYVLTFDPVPDVMLSVQSIEIIPEEGTIAEAPIDTLTVKFNKKIDTSTFTGDDITFTVQGVKKDAGQIGIATKDNQTFTLAMKAINDTLSNGYYAMTIQTADITDFEGYQGRTGKQVNWILFRGGLVQLLTSAWPENSGTVTRKSAEPAGVRSLAPSDDSPNTAKYGSTVILVAEPSKGYEFANWILNGEIVSNEPQYEALAISDLDIVANFTKKSYLVNIECENEGGIVTGSGTGIYEYEASLELTAMPKEDYIFKNWIVNGKTIAGEDRNLTITVDQTLDIQAVYEQEYYHHTMSLAKGWNWISTYLQEPINVNELTTYANRIMSQTEELINDPEYGMVGNIKEFIPGKAYKLEATRMFSNTFRGHLYDTETLPITLWKGWNWIAYPYQKQAFINDVINNASEGDYITSQTGFAEYADGSWEGSLDALIPGNGYLYKSATKKNLSFIFPATAKSRTKTNTTTAPSSSKSIMDIHRYPNTMNMIIQLFRDGMSVSADEYNIYAMADGDMRGAGILVGDKHYLTVYGAEPVKISFIVESINTGETFEANETLVFRDDVVGSRQSPFAISIGDATGIDIVGNDKHPLTVYSLQGVLISREATLKMLHSLPKGVYIVNGQKCFIK